MTILQKIIYLKNYSKEVHTTNRRDVFYCYYVKPNTVLKYYSNTKFILYREKITFIYATTEIQLIFLRNFNL